MIALYDKVILKTGEKAVIVQIYKQGVAYEADIEAGDDYKTDTIRQEDILAIVSSRKELVRVG